ncbi:MAG: bifunctional riboflavin kinase/FAD synthetase [Rubricoccaceae bacterium]|nr:bifunctional riboflavin kinase/FAD synthetase [Rubricoccaceae bacterium]
MTREHGYDEIQRNGRSVLTTGTFDGVHRGHQAILRYLVERAEATGGAATVVTFHPHPREVLADNPVPLLTTLDERADVLEGLGLDRFVVLPFTRDLSLLEPEAYVEDVLLGTIGMQEIVIGYDHHFGRDRRGDRGLLERMGATHGFTVDVIPEQVVEGHAVSSTEVRRALAAGAARQATELLGRPYSFGGTVIHGDGRGQRIGYPTANVKPEERRKLIPAPGVYAVRCEVPGGWSDGMMNVGRRPTFEEDGALTVEVHLFGFEGDLYGRPLRIHTIARLRDERKFDGVEALVAQLHEDRAEAERALQVVP